jgi:predicted porin
LGGGYSDTFGRFGTSAGTGISGFAGNATTARVIRNERAVVYTSPTISGVTGQLEYAFKNGNGEASVNSSSTNGTTYASNNNGFFGVNLMYKNGPLTLAANSSKLSAGDVAAAGFYTPLTTSTSVASLAAAKVSPGVIAAGTNVKYGMYAGNYQVTPDLTVYAGFTTTKTSNQDTPAATNTVEDSKSSNIAFKYVVGQYDLMLNRLNRTSNLAADAVLAPNGNAKLTGFGVNYNLSKMTYAYVRYEKASNVAVTGSGASANVYGDQSITAIGLRMKF